MTDVDPQLSFIQCPKKVLTTAEMTKLRGGVSILTETWRNDEGREWLVCKVIPRDRSIDYPEGVVYGPSIPVKYEDIEVYKVYNLTSSHSTSTSQPISPAKNNNPQQFIPPSYRKMPDLDHRRVRKPLNGLVIVSAQKVIRDRIKKLRLKRKEFDTDTLLSLESLDLSESRVKKARIMY